MGKRFILGTVLILHGLIHVLGVAAYWRLAEVEGLPYGTRLLSGSLEVGEAGVWIFGLLWFVAAVGFVVAALALLLLRPWWRPLTLGVALLSLVITILGWPDAWFGVLVNLAILACLLVGERRGWLPRAGRPSTR
jgi:hypothetical protein